jgi:acetyl-CoA synthetase
VVCGLKGIFLLLRVRHLPARANQVAIIWEGDEVTDIKKVTYQEAYEEVCRLANALKAAGVKKGDTVAIYMPNCPECAYAMLAVARIGAIHSVVFAGFSAESLSDRILDAGSRVVITADEGIRGGKIIPLKKVSIQLYKNDNFRQLMKL